MSHNPSEHLTEVHDNIMLRLQIAAGVVGSDGSNVDVSEYYHRCISEGAMPLSVVKYIHEVLQSRYEQYETTPVNRDMLDIPVKEGFGIGLMIGSTVLTPEERPDFFEFFNERLYGLSNAPSHLDLETLLAMDGKAFVDELRTLSPSAIYEPYTDGPSREYDDARNFVFANALGYAAHCAVAFLEVNSLEIADFMDSAD